MVERVDDLYLPLATVNRFIKSNLPEGVALSKEARLAVSRAASIFVLYCTAAANDIAQNADRRTITPNDVLAALVNMDFGEFVRPLQTALDDFKKASGKATNENQQQPQRAGSSSSNKRKTTSTKSSNKGRKKQSTTSNNKANKDTSVGVSASSAIDIGADSDEAREGEPAHIDSADLAVAPDDDVIESGNEDDIAEPEN